jgi:hypothetical protein
MYHLSDVKHLRMAIVVQRPITIPNEKNKIYFIINGGILFIL